MIIATVAEAKKHIGQTLYWEDRSNRYIFQRSGVLTSTFRTGLGFDGNQEYRTISEYKNLSTRPTVEMD